MRDIIHDLQKFRNSELENNYFIINDHKCFIAYLGSSNAIRLFFDDNRVTTVTVFYDDFIRLFDNRTEDIIIYKFPYNCEDKNEFFQLSTIYDYSNITYEDLQELHELCDFMVKRDLNERKPV